MSNTQELYAAAFNHRGKIKGPEAEQVVRDLAARYPGEHAELAKLLAFFMPKSPKGKTPEAWVALAAAKKDIRNYLRFVCATGTEIVATDGHRLHLTPSTLPRGLYDPVSYVKLWDLQEDCATLPAGHPGKFPDYRRIIPVRKTVPLSDVLAVHLDKTTLRVQHANVTAHVLPAYYEAAALLCTRASLLDANSSVLFEGETGQVAVVMPQRT